MNKKFLSAILFGAMLATSAGTFVSCKDYDDDIDSINKELVDIKSQLAALQTKVDAGKWITSVSSTANGVSITMSDGQTLTLTNGKDGQNGADGAQGEAGAAGKDGKDGSVVEVKDGVLCINGVATEIKVAEEAPAALPCVKVEDGKLMVLGADGKYVATGIEAGAVTAAKTNGVWTITVDGEEIVVPGSAALTSIAIQGDEKDLILNYAKVAKATPWGWKQADGTYDEEMEAGFYTRLNGNVDVLLNPAEADGTAFTYTFKNSKGEGAGVTYFGEARPSNEVLTRAASANGLWTLPAAITKFDAADINELRNELYLKFKENNGSAYLMTLEAVDGLGNVSTRSDYEYTITLKQAAGGASIANMNGLEIGTVYCPSITGPVYDYKLRVNPGVTNLRKAKAFGIEITEDEKGFSASNDAATYDQIKFDYAYVTIAGYVNQGSFYVTFTDGLTASDNLRAEALNAPLNAEWAYYVKNNVKYASDEIAKYLVNYNNETGRSTDKVFVFKHKYDLSTLYAGLSEDAKMLFDESINIKNNVVKTLIGGEAGNVADNYNALNRNGLLQNNIEWSYDSTKKQIEVRFYVTENWAGKNAYEAALTAEGIALTDAMPWDVYSNFQLKTAYQLNLSVLDDVTREEVIMIELPFEFTQPEIGVVGVDRNTEGSFSVWSNHNEWWSSTYHHCDVLYMFGAYDANKFYMPMYDAFNIWTKAPYADKNLNPNAEYYTLNSVGDYNLDGTSPNITMDDIEYEGTWNEYPAYLTWTSNNSIKTAVANQGDDTKLAHDKEAWTYVKTAFDFYGVYPATKDQLGYYGEQFSNGSNNYTAGFRLVFASTIQKSTIEMNDEVYTASAGTNSLFISNEDITATTMLGGDFVLFDGIAGDKVSGRANLNNARGFNETQRPFEAPASYKLSAKYANGDEDDTIPVEYLTNGVWNGVVNGKRVANVNPVNEAKVQIFLMPSMDAVAADANGQGAIAAQNAGLFIVLGNAIEDNQPIEITVQVEDAMGFYNEFKIVAKKLQ